MISFGSRAIYVGPQQTLLTLNPLCTLATILKQSVAEYIRNIVVIWVCAFDEFPLQNRIPLAKLVLISFWMHIFSDMCSPKNKEHYQWAQLSLRSCTKLEMFLRLAFGLLCYTFLQSRIRLILGIPFCFDRISETTYFKSSLVHFLLSLCCGISEHFPGIVDLKFQQKID